MNYKKFLILLLVSILLSILYGNCKSQQVSYNNLYTQKKLEEELSGEWSIDYSQTLKNLLIQNSLDPEIDIDIYHNFLKKMKKDIPYARIYFSYNEQKQKKPTQYTWKIHYSIRNKKNQLQKVSQKGIWKVLSWKAEPIPFMIISLQAKKPKKQVKKKETLKIEFVDKKTIRISLLEKEKNFSFNQIYFKKQNQQKTVKISNNE